MVRVKAVYLITDEGFTIYHQSFGKTELDQDIVGSLLMALRSPSKEALGEGSLSKVDFGEGADMILESGKRIIAIAVVVLDKIHKEQEEYAIRNNLLKFVKKVEEIYAEELTDPIFHTRAFLDVETFIKDTFSGVETLIKEHFHFDD